MTALDGQWLARKGIGKEAIAGVIGLAGPYDFYPFTSVGSRNAFGHVADPAITQPVNFASADAPPMLLLHGEDDTTVRMRHSCVPARTPEQAGGGARTRFYPGAGPNDVVIAPAPPCPETGTPWCEER